MKRIFIFIVIFLPLFLCSCDANNYICVDGIENYSRIQSNYELNHYILPSDDYLKDFEYISAEYHYREVYKSWASLFGIEKSVITATYSPEVYTQAKEHCLHEMQLDNANTIEYNGYVFIENIELAVAQERYGSLHSFPSWFNMFAYHDTSNRLLFLGYYDSKYTSENANEILSDWGSFLKNAFGDIYDFDTSQ